MSVNRSLILGRRFFTTVPIYGEDIISNAERRAIKLASRVDFLVNSRSDLDRAAKYARSAVFSRIRTEDTELTCRSIIEGMLRDKRHKDAYDMYDYFFNQHKIKPTYHCCNYILESRFQQGLVEEALDFHRSIKSGMAIGYPCHGTFRILTKGLVQSGRLDQAEALVKSKEISSITDPDHVAFNHLVRGYLDIGNIDKANLVFDEFKRLKLGVDLSKYPLLCSKYENRVAFLVATFMEYWFKQGKEKEAMECFERSVLAKKFLVSGDTSDALLEILLKYGKKTHAWALYNERIDQSCLSSVTVKIMVDECFNMGRCREAIEMYNKAIAKRCFVSTTYIITRCCENGMLSEAESFFAEKLS